MTNAAKHFDLIFGVDSHIVLAPPAAQPTPVPTPYIGMVFDPFDYLPFIGATVMVNGLPRAQAGTAGVATPSHIPIPGPFGPPPPTHESEVFMGSATVSVDGDAQSHNSLLVLSCQAIGMPAPLRKKGQPPKSLVLPTSTLLAIPSGPPVLIGGPPTISLTALGMRAGMAGLGKLGKGLRQLQRGSGKVGKATRRVTDAAQAAGEKLAKKLELGDVARSAINRAICTVTGHPVDVATGKVFTDHVDVELPGPMPFRWERVWYSTSTYRGPLGHGWHHAYDAALYVTDEVVLYRTPDGRYVSFPVIEPGQQHFHPVERLTLLHDDSGYAVRVTGGNQYAFQDIGRDHGEHALSAISDPAGNTIHLRYDRQHCLAEVIDSVGRRLQFEHDEAGRITSVSAPRPDNPQQSFAVARYQYDSHGDLTQWADALGNPFRYEYAKHLLERETDRNGLSFHFEYDGDTAEARCTRTWGDGGIYDHRLRYDLEHNITTVTNSLGAKTQYEHAGGLVVCTVDAVGATTRVDYDDKQRKVRETDALHHSRRFAYDARGNLVEMRDFDGARLGIEYDAQDRPVAVTDANGGKWQMAYDGQGRLAQRTNPLGQAIRFTYTGRRLTAITDPLGHTTRLDYDAQHNLSAMHTPEGAVRAWDYDKLGRVIASTDANGNTQRRTLDLLGRPIRIHEPDGNDRHLEYDGEGNLVHVVDAHNDVTFAYQGMGRLASRTQAGTTVRFEYDSEEQLTGIINEHGHVYRFELDPRGDVSVEHGFDGVRRGYQRDRAGRVAKLVRQGGVTSTFQYDPAGRVHAVNHSDRTHESFRYRADGLLIEAANDDARVQFERDPVGRVLRELCDGRWVVSVYDARGQRVGLQSSLGADQRIERDAMGGVVGLRHASKDSPKPFEARFERDLLGLELERSLPGGVRARWQRDKLGRPVHHELAVTGMILRARSYRWTEGDRLKSIIDAQSGPIEFAHDPLGNLAWAKYADGTREFRMPDAVGNLFRSEDRKDRKYGPAGQVLQSTDDSGRVTTYAYDPEGNLVEKSRSDGERWQYRWRADGMLKEVERPDGALVSFAYDALGRRVRKTFRGNTTRWVWDGNVPLHEWVERDDPALNEAPRDSYSDIEASVKLREALRGEHAQRGPPEHGTLLAPITWLFEPESFAPLAKLVGARRYSIVTDHLGTPTTMLDDRGSVVWSAEVNTWGELHRLEGDRAACPFRWPGQYEDVETGLYYNRFRYYDADCGHYVSQDPIRLRGGAGLHAYVRDPLTSLDPLGLSCEPTRIVMVDPATLRWSQTTAGGRGRAAEIRKSMGERGWDGPPIDVVQTPDGLVTVDHTRAAVALEQGIPAIPAKVHDPNEALPADMLERPWNRSGETASTWGEAVRLRGAGQAPPIGPTGSSVPPKLPNK